VCAYPVFGGLRLDPARNDQSSFDEQELTVVVCNTTIADEHVRRQADCKLIVSAREALRTSQLGLNRAERAERGATQ
jgi:hypothetical protein